MKINRGRYQNDENKQEKKAAKRKYMSYEDVPIEDYREEDPMPNNLTKRFLKMFLILFLAVIAVMAVLNLEKLTPENIAHWFQYDLLGKTDGDGYPTGFTGSSITDCNFDLISGVPAYCSDTTIAVLNKNAGICQEKQHSYASPIMSTNAGYGIVYNMDATGYTIIKRDSIEYNGAVKQKIFAADIAPNGVYALLTKSEDYLAALSVYRSDHLEKFKYSFADYYMNTVSVNKDGTKAILSGISARNGEMVSVIYILDFTQDNFMQKYEVENTYIYDVKYLDNGNAFAVGENKLFFIDINNGSKSEISYNDRYLTAYALKRDQGVIMSLSKNPDGRECDLLSFDTSGNKDCEISTGDKIVSLDMRGDDRAALSSETITVYDKGGEEKGSADTDSDARKILYNDRNSFYTLGKSRISSVTVGN